MTTDAPGSVTAERRGHVGRIVIDNHARRNAMSLAMWRALDKTVAVFAADAAVRVVVVSGEGGKAFVSGADISRFGSERQDAAATKDYDDAAFGSLDRLYRLEKPTVAAIEGFCLGGGVSLAIACDIRLCNDRARFGVPAARLGLGYGAQALGRLVDVVGAAAARRLMLTADQIDAAEAKRIGLAHEVFPDDEFAVGVDRWCEGMAANAPLTLRALKIAFAEIGDGAANFDRSRAAVRACFDSSDFREGQRAFMEKRKPIFTGN